MKLRNKKFKYFDESYMVRKCSVDIRVLVFVLWFLISFFNYKVYESNLYLMECLFSDSF